MKFYSCGEMLGAFLAISVCFFSSCVSISGTDLKGAVVIERVFHPAPDRGFVYYLLAVKADNPNERFPLILALHGTGENGKDYLDNWSAEAAKRRVMIASANVEYFSGGKKAVVEDYVRLIQAITEKYPVDKSRIYIAGVSSGALLARKILEGDPSKWNGAIFIASSNIEKWMNKPETDPKKFPPLLYVHGRMDEQHPFENTEKVIGVLKDKGFNATLIDDPEAGHEHKIEWNPAIFDWIEKQEKEKIIPG